MRRSPLLAAVLAIGLSLLVSFSTADGRFRCRFRRCHPCSMPPAAFPCQPCLGYPGSALGYSLYYCNPGGWEFINDYSNSQDAYNAGVNAGRTYVPCGTPCTLYGGTSTFTVCPAGVDPNVGPGYCLGCSPGYSVIWR